MRNRPETWLELDLSGETVAGTLHDGDRAARRFSGWLELVAAVEETRSRRAHDTPQASTTAPLTLSDRIDFPRRF
jgi:hypothetical protein